MNEPSDPRPDAPDDTGRRWLDEVMPPETLAEMERLAVRLGAAIVETRGIVDEVIGVHKVVRPKVDALDDDGKYDVAFGLTAYGLLVHLMEQFGHELVEAAQSATAVYDPDELDMTLARVERLAQGITPMEAFLRLAAPFYEGTQR